MAEHEKGCGCGHSHQDEGIDEKIATDVATKSLSDALQVSFTVLKVIMAVLVVLFIASGVFIVDSKEQALVLHFGAIRTDSDGVSVLKSGLHWAWPAPIDEIIKIPVTQQQVLDVDSFWYYLSEADKTSGIERPAGRDLTAQDGYCLTRNDNTYGTGADYSIVHTKWRLTYSISDVELFFRNIYYRATAPGEDFIDVMGKDVNPLLTALVDDAVVSSLVKYTIDEATGYDINISVDVEKKLQGRLNAISSGIIVESIQPQKTIWPRQLNEVFEESNKASQDSQRLVTEARSYAEQKLNKAGGVDAEKVLKYLTDENLTDKEKEKYYSLLAGDGKGQIAKARAYRTEVVNEAKANARYLNDVLEGYRKNPEFVLQNIYQQFVREVMEKAEEKMFLEPDNEIRVMFNKDPYIKKPKKEEKKE